MGEETLIAAFPGLGGDTDFKITSPQNTNYNCIAWAYHFQDRWMWPGGTGTKTIDGFKFWPDGIDDTEDVSAFIEAFKQKGYEQCETGDFETGYRKIALYVKKGTTQCTHAARQLNNGKWTSKLGRENDIQHGSPYAIEGDVYGSIYCFMRIPHI